MLLPAMGFPPSYVNETKIGGDLSVGGGDGLVDVSRTEWGWRDDVARERQGAGLGSA